MKRKSNKLWDNRHLGNAMKPGYWNRLATIPVLLGSLFAIGSILVASYLFNFWGFIAGIVFMPAGMWLGWQINMGICYYYLGWNWQKVDDCFNHSKIPDEWLLDINIENSSQSTMAKWEENRSRGKWRYVIVYGFFLMGSIMTVASLAVDIAFDDVQDPLYFYLIDLITNAIIGSIIFLVLWKLNDKRMVQLEEQRRKEQQ